ncbi:MAG: hypothetical protein ABJB86_11530 [Bacteroidota bacterium]
MDTSRLKTLEQVSDAMDAVEDARGMKGLSEDDEQTLEDTSVTLRNLQRTIIKSLTENLVANLQSDSAALEDLTDEINQSAKNLDTLTNVLQKTSQAIAGLVNVVTLAVKVGLI